jgi:hypothetical protein
MTTCDAMAEDGMVKGEVTRTTTADSMLRACLAEAAAAVSRLEPLSCCRFTTTAAACFRGACTPATAGDARAEHAADRAIAAVKL